MEEITFRDRCLSFEGPIMDASRDNPVIHRIIQEYAIGHIITKEEALSQMVVMLATNWQAQQRKAFEMLMHLEVKP